MIMKIRDEKGQALVLVLILLLVGALIITPLLAYMTTGLKAGQVYEQLMLRFYAADAGVKDALWKIMNDPSLPQNVGDNLTYDLEDEFGNPIYINGKRVEVQILLEEDVKEFLDDLLDRNYSGVHGDWQVAEDIVGDGTYTIGVTYNGSMEKEFITGIGVWLMGTYECNDSSSGDDDITDTFPTDNFTAANYKGGTAFIWEWQPPVDRPEFGKKSGVYYRSQTFDFSPEHIPEFYISWASAVPASIGVVTSGENFGIYKITSTATDNITEKQTEVTSYVLSQGGEVSILNWETSP